MAKKILIVDDEPDILRIEMFRLRSLGYKIITAVNGQEALDLIHKERPNLILLDLLIPFIDGYEVCRQVKTHKKLRHIPIILLTAISDYKVAEVTEKFKAVDYIIKPFEQKELFKKIKKILK